MSEQLDKNSTFKQGLSRAREAYRAMPTGTSLKSFLIAYGRNFPSTYSMAKSMGLSHGSMTHVLEDTITDSPSLRKPLGIPKNPRRWRWIVGVDEQLYEDLSAFCEENGLTREQLTRYSFRIYKDVLGVL